MLSLVFEIGARRCARLILFATLSLIITTVSARAQIGAIDSDPTQAIGTRVSARNTIQGFVTLPTGARLNARVKVRIVGNTGGSLFTMTDEDGAFIFPRLAGGTYYVTVSAGEEYEPATEIVDVFDSGTRGGSTQTIYIQLRFKKSATEKAGTFDAALAGVPKAALKQYDKGLKAAQVSDNKKAVEAFKNAIELYPDFMLAYNALGLQYLRLNDLTAAAEALRAALRLAPDNFTPLLNYGVVLFYQKEHAAAAAQFRQALKQRDSSAGAHFFLARTLIKLGQYQEAEKEFQQTIQIGGGEADESYRYLGGIYKELGDNARAIAALEKYLSLEPKTKDADSIREIIKELRNQPATTPK
ncbi:MAG: tetratricopeptide repeat protein [Pyrinomonadaceae bacterium]